MYVCAYCGERFCESHFKAKPPWHVDTTIRNAFENYCMTEFRKPGGHPCAPYYDFLKHKMAGEKEIADLIYEKNLDVASGNKTNTREDVNSTPAPVVEEYKKPFFKEPESIEPVLTQKDCPRCNKSDEKEEFSFGRGKSDYVCYKCKRCNVLFDKFGKIIHLPESSIQPIKKKKMTKSVVVLVTVIFLILLIAIPQYLVFSSHLDYKSDKINKTRTVSENVTLSSRISFKNILANSSYYDKKEIFVKGFLRRYVEGDGTSGRYVRAIEDDDGNRLIVSNPDADYQTHFPKKGISLEIYLISGIIKKSYNQSNILISSMNQSERDASGIQQVEKQVIYVEEINYSVKNPRFPSIRNFILSLFGQKIICSDGTILNNCSFSKPFYCGYSGLEKNPVYCGCPKGQRLYGQECILIVKCQDNTLNPECSENKPKQCVNGKLIDNSDMCGCPENYRKSGSSCSKILRCDDGTEYDRCASQNPKYCEAGNLINKASICGCSWFQYQDGETCIPKTKAIEKAVLKYTNEERAKHGLSPLSLDDKLSDIARAHSQDMADNNFFEHINLQGDGPTERATKAGYSVYKSLGAVYTIGIGENIGKMPTGNVEGIGYVADTPDGVAKAQVNSWMTSPGHRQNILTASYTNLGVGVAEDGIYYLITQDFW